MTKAQRVTYFMGYSPNIRIGLIKDFNKIALISS